MASVYFGLCVPSICDLTAMEGLPEIVANALNEATKGTMPAIAATDVKIY